MRQPSHAFGTIFSSYPIAAGSPNGWGLFVGETGSGRLFLRARNSGSTNQAMASTATAGFQMIAGQWNHIALTRDNSRNMRIFINGRLVSAITPNWSLVANTASAKDAAQRPWGTESTLLLARGSPPSKDRWTR